MYNINNQLASHAYHSIVKLCFNIKWFEDLAKHNVILITSAFESSQVMPFSFYFLGLGLISVIDLACRTGVLSKVFQTSATDEA